MPMYEIEMRVIVRIDPAEQLSASECRELARDYQPTPEVPEPDEEWLAEEWSMRQCANAHDVTVTSARRI